MKNIDNVIGSVDETSLAHAFYDAYASDDFKEFVDSLNIEEKVLMKYTSSLEDACEECRNCKKCKGIEKCPNKVPGYVYTPEKDKNMINFSYVACKKENERLEKNAYKDNIDLFDMPKVVVDASFKIIYKDDKARVPIIKYFKEFMDNYKNETKPKGLYLTGSFGSGKTYLIASLFNEMAKKGVRSVLIYYPEFLSGLKASFNTNYGEQLNHIKKIPLLLLDDIGAENCSNWSRDEVLGPILQYRMENHLPTFFTSNLTMEELEKSLAITSAGVDKVKARRIIERIKQLTTTLELVSENRRD